MDDDFEYMKMMTLQAISDRHFVLGRRTRGAVDAYIACAQIIYRNMGSLGFSAIRQRLNDQSPSPDSQKGYMLAERLLDYYYLQLTGDTRLEDRAQAVVAQIREQLNDKAQDSAYAYLLESYLLCYEYLTPIELFDRIGIMHGHAAAARHKVLKQLPAELKRNYRDAINNVLDEITRVAKDVSLMIRS